MLYNGYLGANIVHAVESASLFDISGILGNLASGADVPLLAIKPESKPTPAAISKYFTDDILANKQLLIDMLDASSNPLLLFATIIYDMKMHYVDDLKIIDFINNINASLIKSIPEPVVTEYLIEPFKGL
jgi:hypothetical protein